MTHVLRCDAMSEHLVQWKRKREPCNIQNVTSIGLIPQRGLMSIPKYCSAMFAARFLLIPNICKRQSRQNCLNTVVKWSTLENKTIRTPNPHLPNKVGAAHIAAQLCMEGWGRESYFFSRLKSTKLQKSP